MILKLKSLVPILFVAILTVTTQSCVNSDDYDFHKLSDKVDWTPNMIVPVGYGTYTLYYLLNQHEEDPNDRTIVLDADGLIHIQFLQDDVFNYNVADVLTFPTQSVINLSYSLPSFGVGIPYASIVGLGLSPQTDQIQVSTSGSTAITLYELDLNADIRFVLSNPLNTEVDLIVTIPNGTQGGTAINEIFTLPAFANNQVEILNLANLNLLFNTPYSTNNDVDITFEVVIKDNASHIITSSGNLGVNLEVQNIDFLLAQGDFGNQVIDIGSGTIDRDVDFWDKVEGDFLFTDPKISLHLENSVGVPFQINADITGYDMNGNSAALNADALQPAYPNTVSITNPFTIDPITETVVYNKDNSDIVDLMALPPSDRIDYTGNIALNPVGAVAPTPATPNLISSNSAIDVNIEIDIPLEFTADGIILRDTIDDIDISDSEKILNAAVVIVTENGYPLDVTIDKIFMTDAEYNVIDELTNNEVIDAASVFTSGDKIGEVDPSSIVEVSHEIKLNESQLENLNLTDNLIINASVITDNGAIPVKLMGDYELKFTISVQAEVDPTK